MKRFALKRDCKAMPLRLPLESHISRRTQKVILDAGHVADRTNDLGIQDVDDAELFDRCLADAYDLLLTRDRFVNQASRQPSLQAMALGLTLLEIRFQRYSGGATEESEVIRATLRVVETHLLEHPDVRRWRINGNKQRISPGETDQDISRLLAKRGWV